ncbi:unnamed protein product, partial [Sphagnum compactum]
DFERKASLFSMAIAQVLIINMWEYTIGLYNGANMSLLKTVFEANLQLFQKKGYISPKTMLLFVIRDYIGKTPLDNLCEIIKNDLNSIWKALSKPQALNESGFSELFLIEFVSLPHKHLKREGFEREVAELSSCFYDQKNPHYMFRNTTGKLVPVDGFCAYSGSIWEAIKSNRDLDLPTQQQLLAQFRCDEISAIIFEEASQKLSLISSSIGGGTVLTSLGQSFLKIESYSMDKFTDEASRYDNSIVEKKKTELRDRIQNGMKQSFLIQLQNIVKKACQIFSMHLEDGIKGNKKPFVDIVSTSEEKALTFFKENARSSVIPGSEWSYADSLNECIEFIRESTHTHRREEIKRAVESVNEHYKKNIGRNIARLLDDYVSGLSESSTNAGPLWSRMFEMYKDMMGDLSERLKRNLNAFQVRTSPSSMKEFESVEFKAYQYFWEIFVEKLSDEMSDTLILVRMRKRFEKIFKYDSNSNPRIWIPGEDMTAPYKKAIEKTLQLLEEFSVVTHIPKDQTFITISNVINNVVLIPHDRKRLLEEAFRREAEVAFVEAGRSVLSQSTSVPIWMIVLLVILGWNEFMTILSNPIYFLLLSLGLVMLYFLHSLGMLPKIMMM